MFEAYFDNWIQISAFSLRFMEIRNFSYKIFWDVDFLYQIIKTQNKYNQCIFKWFILENRQIVSKLNLGELGTLHIKLV